MEQKAKLIIIGLIIVTVASLALFVQASSVKQELSRERDDLKTENDTLNSKLNKVGEAMRSYESRITSLTNELNSVAQQKSDLEKRFELVNKAREELVQKLKEQESKKVEETSSRQQYIPQTNDAYWAEVLKSKSDLEIQLGNVRSELKSLQMSNEQLQREKSNMELDLNNLKRDREDLKRQLEYSQKLVDSMSSELVREKNDKTQIQDSYKTLKNDNDMLSRQLQSLNSRKVNLDQKIQELQDSKSSLERRISEMEVMLTDRVSQIDNLKTRMESVRGDAVVPVAVQSKKESVELPAIVVKPQPDKPSDSGNPDAGLSGKVLAVNKENNFIIVDLGQDSGIKVGDMLKVYRGTKPIAGVEVIQIRHNISACDIRREATPIKIGDTVR